MKIAIGIDSDSQIHKGHFGDSPRFAVYDLKDEQVIKTDERRNPFTEDEDGNVHHGKVKGITSFLPDCDIFLGNGFGMHSMIKLQQKVKAVWLTRQLNLADVLQALRQKDTAPFLQFDFSSKKFIPLKNFDLLYES